MLTLNDYDNLCDHIRPLARGRKPYICSFDGHRQSGKTTVAARLGSDLGVPYFSTDAYRLAEREGLPYVDQVALEVLSEDLIRCAPAAVVLIEGICVGWTLRRLKLVAGTKVYCKRMTQAGLWADEMSNYVEIHVIDIWLSPFDREIVRYHLELSPHVHADIVYCRNGDSESPPSKCVLGPDEI